MMNGWQNEKTITYRIRIKGRLDPKWSDWFDGFSITSIKNETILLGTVPDQAALLGILTKINDLSLELISVNEISDT